MRGVRWRVGVRWVAQLDGRVGAGGVRRVRGLILRGWVAGGVEGVGVEGKVVAVGGDRLPVSVHWFKGPRWAFAGIWTRRVLD